MYLSATTSRTTLAAIGFASAALIVVESYVYITSNNYFVRLLGPSRPVANAIALGHTTLLLVCWAAVLRRTLRSTAQSLPYLAGSVAPAVLVYFSPDPWVVVESFRFVVALHAWWMLLLLAALGFVVAKRSRRQLTSHELRTWQLVGATSFGLGLVMHRLSASEPAMILLQVAAVLLVPCASLIVVVLQRRASVAPRIACGVAALLALSVATIH